MMFLSVVTIASFTMVAGSLALSLGVLFPQFETENAAKGFTGELWWAMAKVFLLCAAATLIPLRQSLKRLEAIEV
ncbi:MAG: hypothetical protein EXR94_12930 [Gemmatimonadetes bacterium]|nr:hypothetical protein [Gemmatimonadota bacterium]